MLLTKNRLKKIILEEYQKLYKKKISKKLTRNNLRNIILKELRENLDIESTEVVPEIEDMSTYNVDDEVSDIEKDFGGLLSAGSLSAEDEKSVANRLDKYIDSLKAISSELKGGTYGEEPAWTWEDELEQINVPPGEQHVSSQVITDPEERSKYYMEPGSKIRRPATVSERKRKRKG